MVEQKDLRDKASETAGTRLAWVKPDLQRLSAGSAESNITGVVSDGFNNGS